LCVGETKSEYEAHETKRVIHDQLTTAISNLASREIDNLVIAYEPVWAISNGINFANHVIAKPDQVAGVVTYIREIIAELYGDRASEAVRIIYGGSSNAENAYSYLVTEGVDGLLPGGASLNYLEFSGIIAAAARVEALALKEAK
jgi:triosephosphate isomerase